MRRFAFTLIELLVVVAIIAILAAILFPVFALARDKARAIASLSNARQIGLAVHLYIQDNDESLPLTTHSSATVSWLVTLQPYAGGKILYRAPGDRSVNWETPLPGQTRVRLSTYNINGYLTPDGGYTTLASVNSPAQTAYIVEQKDNRTGDHIHPYCWIPYGCHSHDGHTSFIDPLTEIETERYQGGAHYVFVDGHARWHRFPALYAPPSVNRFHPAL